MKHNKKIALSMFALCLALAVSACGQKSANSSSDEKPEALFGKFTALDTLGEARDASIFEEHDVTMINIWGTFCPPCIKEMPDLAELNAEYADKDFQVVGIVIDVPEPVDGKPAILFNDALEIIEKTGANYLHLLASEDLKRLRLDDVVGVPESIFVDSTGKVIGEPYVGARSKEEWLEIVDEKLAQVE